MNGVVVFRMARELRVVHRAVLTFAEIKHKDSTIIRWAHLGEASLQQIDIEDPSESDDDKTDYSKLAVEVFETITSPRFATRDVYWTWDASAKKWTYEIAAMEVPLPQSDVLDEDLVGYGSLGRG